VGARSACNKDILFDGSREDAKQRVVDMFAYEALQGPLVSVPIKESLARNSLHATRCTSDVAWLATESFHELFG
jgi:hypothetical protein